MLTKKKIIIGIGMGVLSVIYYNIYKYTSFSFQCPFHFITGYYCPGCGITRMLFALLKLKIYQAFRFNPLVFILLCLGVMCYGVKIFGRHDLKISSRVYYVIIVLLVIYGVLRNIPLFSFLRPTIIK